MEVDIYLSFVYSLRIVHPRDSVLRLNAAYATLAHSFTLAHVCFDKRLAKEESYRQ